jgi:hypothetical protein
MHGETKIQPATVNLFDEYSSHPEQPTLRPTLNVVLASRTLHDITDRALGLVKSGMIC